MNTRLKQQIVKVKWTGDDKWRIALLNPNEEHKNGSKLIYPIQLLCSDDTYERSHFKAIEPIKSLEELREIGESYEEQ